MSGCDLDQVRNACTCNHVDHEAHCLPPFEPGRECHYDAGPCSGRHCEWMHCPCRGSQ